MKRIVLGLVAAVLLIGGAAIFFFADISVIWVASGCIRAGGVLFAIWLAYNQLEVIAVRTPLWVVQGTLAGLLIMAVKPRAALVVMPIIVALWMLRPRGSKGASPARQERKPRD